MASLRHKGRRCRCMIIEEGCKMIIDSQISVDLIIYPNNNVVRLNDYLFRRSDFGCGLPPD